jgi:hypothetical protein
MGIGLGDANWKKWIGTCPRYLFAQHLPPWQPQYCALCFFLREEIIPRSAAFGNMATQDFLLASRTGY